MIDLRPATDPDSMETATGEQLRSRYVVDNLFVPGEMSGVYSFEDRMLVAGVVPLAGTDVEFASDVLHSAAGLERDEPALARRELGVVNVGSSGTVLVDDEELELGHLDGLYVGVGRRVCFRGDGARFYTVSATAHRSEPTVLIPHESIDAVELGDDAKASRRKLYRYVWDGGHPSCQLQFGVTVVEQGSVWNTMPPHLHDHRTEVYLYTGLAAGDRVVHLMGRPGQTRHVLLADGQAVLSPNWSIHAGAGTSSYAFVWAMAGENNDYGDLTPLALETL
jgi:4-deoxy-L-threo-5-hexosulose-uronate ketol-isomerase